VVALLNALRASHETATLDIVEQAALWLCVAIGANPMQFALLRECDFERLVSADDNGANYLLRIPRHKKRHSRLRAEFKTRKLTTEIGEVLDQLVLHNAELRRRLGRVDKSIAKPLFSRESLRKSMIGTPMHEYALGLSASEFTQLVSKAVDKLNVKSPRTGASLHLNCRRFRYTFATRLVREGASQRVVAEMLDHTDLQNVQCYFDIKSDIVESLDRAMAMVLGPLAQAFLGHIIRGETEGNAAPSSRIYHAKRDSVDPLGDCGSFSFCGYYAPVACYTCVKFQPWMEAPHEEILRSLLAERARREEQGLHSRMVNIYDNTILAVADVIDRIGKIKKGEKCNVN
jgi:hypothetical protein